MATTDLAKRYVIGQYVYAKWRYPDKDDHWYELHVVKKITAQKVFIQPVMEDKCIVVPRATFERNGWSFSTAHRAVFYLEMPEEYRRQTIGYLMNEKPRKLLGLRDGYTPQELKSAYRKRAAETHPDHGGSPQEFLAVQQAYEQIQNGASAGMSLGEYLRRAKETAEEHLHNA